MFLPYKIRTLEVSPPLVLSPMSGVTTSAFRRLICELNPRALGLLVSEFISVEAMTRRVPRTLAMMRFDPSERPFAIQIFGYDPIRMRDAALMCQDAGVDLVDINCGCPAPKVVRKGGGCELMRQPQHLAKIIREVRAVLQVPLTIKIRAGWDDTSRNALEIATLAQSEGVDAIAVHGRTRAQLYRGDADWNLVAEVAGAVKIPVLGSGDVVDAASAAARMKLGVAGLFIGRGALQNPFIFSEIFEGTRRDLKKEPMLLISILERYRELLEMQFPPHATIGKLKQLVSQMCRGHAWRRELCRVPSMGQFGEVLGRIKDQGGNWPSPVEICDDDLAQKSVVSCSVEEVSS